MINANNALTNFLQVSVIIYTNIIGILLTLEISYLQWQWQLSATSSMSLRKILPCCYDHLLRRLEEMECDRSWRMNDGIEHSHFPMRYICKGAVNATATQQNI